MADTYGKPLLQAFPHVFACLLVLPSQAQAPHIVVSGGIPPSPVVDHLQPTVTTLAVHVSGLRVPSCHNDVSVPLTSTVFQFCFFISAGSTLPGPHLTSQILMGR